MRGQRSWVRIGKKLRARTEAGNVNFEHGQDDSDLGKVQKKRGRTRTAE